MAGRQAQQVIIMVTERLTQMRLFQLISPSLPTGAFSYSQGLEWAVETGWVKDRQSLVEWLGSMLYSSFRELEIPLLQRLYCACEEAAVEDFKYWAAYLMATRETRELRLEEVNRGRAMAKILEQLDQEIDTEWLKVLEKCQLAGFALGAFNWGISLEDAAFGYTWGWLENMVMAAVKTVPLGQAAGQQSLAELSMSAAEIIEQGLYITDAEMGGSCPAFSISSCLHETQYSRLFRS